jgi:YbbR domain-containing protein
MKKSTQELKSLIFENGSYKLVALFVTLILWITILGRRDFVLSKDVDLEFLLPKQMVIAETINRKVSVKVSGPRVALKKFAQNPGTITVDLARSPLGPNRAFITSRNVEVPFGVKVLSVNPEVINVTLVPTGSN